MAAEPQGALVGQAIGGYRIVARIGKGGMGEVYVGVHPTLGKRVAIKVLSAELARDVEMRRRFFDEARAAAALASPNIVDILDLAELPDGTTYMAMEFLEGESLADLIARVGPVPAARAVAIAVPALEGLAAAHAEGIVHRDLKPANLFLARSARGPVVKLLDFGVAKLMGRVAAGGATQTGTLLGTPAYMSPEQASGSSRAVDARADVYAFGVLLYEMLTGRPPFLSDNWGQLLVMHQAEAPAPLRVDGVTPALEAVVLRALAKRPEDRYAGAEPLRLALLEAMGGASALPPLPEPVPPYDLEALAPRPSARGILSDPAQAYQPTVRSLPVGAGGRDRLRWVAPVLSGAALVAALVLFVASRASPRGASRPPPPDPAPAALPPGDAQSCRFTLTDETGAEHPYGGTRVRQVADREGVANIWVNGGGSQGITLGCTPLYGESGLVFFTMSIPHAALVPGPEPRTLADGALMIDFNATLPEGFSEKTYRGGATLTLREYGVKAGTWIRGSFTATVSAAGKSLPLRGDFAFKL